MKKFKSYNHLFLTVSTFLCGSILTFASTIPGHVPVHISGKPLVSATDASTYISDNNRVMLPFRLISESLNIDIQWEAPYVIVNGTHAVTNEPIHIKLKSNNRELLLNGTPYLADQAIEIVDGHSYIPIRLFAEVLGYDVAWTNQSVYITLPTPIIDEPVVPSTPINTSPSYSSGGGGGSSSNSSNESTDENNNTSDQPSDENDITSDQPSDENDITSDQPSDKNDITSDQPSDENDITSDQPSDENDITSDQPSDENDITSDQPSDENDITSDQPSDENDITSDQPSDENNNVPSWPTFPGLPNKPALPEVPAPPALPDNSPVDTRTQFENEVLTLVNKERQKQGLKSLQMNESVRTLAREKSRDMSVNNYFDHNSPTHGSAFDMLKKAGIAYSSAAENIAQGYTTPQAVVTGWMNSPGHRKNILDGKLTHIGVGYYASGNYWTQIFMTPR